MLGRFLPSAAGLFRLVLLYFFCSAFGDYSHLIREAKRVLDLSFRGDVTVTDHAGPL